MRIFTAAVLPAQAKTGLGGLMRLLEETVPGRYVLPENLHCTLAFIGEVEPERVEDVSAALRVAAKDCPAVEMRLSGLGFFGARGNAILWHGIEGAQALAGVNAALVGELRQRELRVDDTRFKAHITLARKVNLARHELTALPSLAANVRVSQLAVYESTRVNGVLRYVPLRIVSLEHGQ